MCDVSVFFLFLFNLYNPHDIVYDTLYIFASGFDSYHPYPEVRTDLDDWDHTKNKYKEKTSTLSTYKW